MDVVHRFPNPQPKTPRRSAKSALEDLRFIRQCVENAGSFTAVPGLGSIVVGATAVAAAVVAATHDPATLAWLRVWLAEAVIASTLGIWMLVRKARAAGAPLASGPGRRFALNLLPPVLAAAALTVALVQAGHYAPLPGLWLLLYGTAVVTGGAFSVRAVTLMGLSFMGLGLVALFVPGGEDVFMGIGFGGLHIAFGQIIRKRHGG
ncbi:MAG: hypothetical protein CMJ83_21545 [Planctomycetes bacterium]|nr:hypothetical protein [Planctomycetota bacterium]